MTSQLLLLHDALVPSAPTPWPPENSRDVLETVLACWASHLLFHRLHRFSQDAPRELPHVLKVFTPNFTISLAAIFKISIPHSPWQSMFSSVCVFLHSALPLLHDAFYLLIWLVVCLSLKNVSSLRTGCWACFVHGCVPRTGPGTWRAWCFGCIRFPFTTSHTSAWLCVPKNEGSEEKRAESWLQKSPSGLV